MERHYCSVKAPNLILIPKFGQCPLHEKEVFESCRSSFSTIMNAGSVAEAAKAENGTRRRIEEPVCPYLAIRIEANENFLQLQQIG